tara:strand:+ start:359 stop:643 length:285 start_codon:yes stop_codon:yes gene_type:complete
MKQNSKLKSIREKSKRWNFQYGKHKRLNIVIGFWINKYEMPSDTFTPNIQHHFWFDFEIKILNIWLGFSIDKTLGRKINIRKSYKMYKNYSINR